MEDPTPARLVVVPVIRGEDGSVLLCRMAADRGVFPGQWALPGGGVEPGETLAEALRREVREELGVEVRDARPLFFRDGTFTKTFAGGARRAIYMVFLLYECSLESPEVRLNEEFTESAWVSRERLGGYDLNIATRETFRILGLLPA